MQTIHRRTGLPRTGGPTPRTPHPQPRPQLTRPALAPAVRRPLPCRVEDPELWFAESPEGVEFAKALCGTCPARAACLAGAIDRAEPWGVWGGELFVQGAIVARKRPRGRPRKNPVAA